MKLLKASIISGSKYALLVTLLLVFAPPLLVGFLPVWSELERLASEDKALQALCAGPKSILISRWLYTYRFSGSTADAAFNGALATEGCEKRFRIYLRRIDSNWVIVKVVAKD